MAHRLSTDPKSGQISMMFVGDTPWHELGTKLDSLATSKEAIRAAHLDWQVEKYPLFYETPLGKRNVDGQFVLMRKDLWEKGHGSYFGIVSKGYQPLQNEIAFEFFDSLVGSNAAVYDTAGALGKGERVWILAKLPDIIRVAGDDICEQYLLLSNSHDGKSSVQMKFTPIRVVCQNTLTMALEQGVTYRVPHKGKVLEKLNKSELADFIRNRFAQIEHGFQQLAEIPMTRKKVDEYLQLVFPDPSDPTNLKGFSRALSNRQTGKRYFETGHGNQEKGVAGTLWAAYNGITEMVDYGEPTRDLDRHLNSIWFGDGYSLKVRAYRIALDNIKSWAG